MEYFFEHPNFSSASPGDITDIRSENVSGRFFAFLAVKFELHKYLKFSCPGLSQELENFVHSLQHFADMSYTTTIAMRSLDSFPKVCLKNLTASLHILRFKQSQTLFALKFIQVLADIWESLCAAIFLDSGQSFEIVSCNFCSLSIRFWFLFFF
jgi:endoribonuclease Dicer